VNREGGVRPEGRLGATKNVKPYIPPVFHVISANIAKYGNPLGLSSKDCTSWAEGLQIPERAEAIFYTGGEYQMIPYVPSLVAVLKRVKFEDTLFTAFKGLQAVTEKIGVNLMKTYAGVAGRESGIYNSLLRMAALSLWRLGVDFAYLGDRELYSGALLYEYGLFEELEEQAKRVTSQFKEANVTRIITLSPHSAEVFQKVYPQFIDDFDFEVSPYVSVLAAALKKSRVRLSLPERLTVTIHDPCHLARSLKVTEEPRQVIQAIGNLELREVAAGKEETRCCGAPCETIYPELSELLATKRLDELAATGAEAVVTLCPFCHANLTRAANLTGKDLRVIDLVEIIYQASEASSAKA
jgi:Fe-S oxidoreductase